MPSKPLQILSSVLLLCVIVVVVLGAYTRLADAGLGCPDWPTCYGHLWVPETQDEVNNANEKFAETPVEHDKTWPEQIHRIFASSLGVFILVCFYLVNAGRAKEQKQSQINSVSSLLISLVVLTVSLVVLNVRESAFIPMLEGVIGIVLIAFFSNLLRIKKQSKNTNSNTFLLVSLLSGLVILQGLFGMWTVTLKLWPKVVTAHLLGGFTVLSLIALFWKSMLFSSAKTFATSKLIRRVSFAVLFITIAQIALGGWVSSNYAALACPDFPLCQNEMFPEADFASGFNVLQKIGPNYLGGKLDNTARIAIHLSHRVGAVIATIGILALAVVLLRLKDSAARPYAFTLIAALGLQISLGISNIIFALPLSIAVLHNAGGALLLLSIIFTLSAQRKIEDIP